MQHKNVATIMIYAVVLAVSAAILLCGPVAYAFDEENCLFCHKYRGLSYHNKEGKFKLLYVTEDLYVNSPHGNLRCTDCHANVDKFPHGEPKKVDCMLVCHMNEPSSGKQFSHKKVGDFLAKSAHSPVAKDGKPKQNAADYPDCKTCHQDPLYRPLAFLKEERPGLAEMTIYRCSVCHENKEFMRKFYNHFTSRMQKQRSPKELLEMCSECHADTVMMKRHNLENVIGSYLETYHGKAVSLGNELAADCNDCHVVPGESIHSIHNFKDPESAAYKDNIYKTCSAVECHPRAALNLAGYKAHVIVAPHKNPVEFYAVVFFVLLTLGSFIPLMLFTVLDMLRNLFPNAALIKKEKKDDESDTGY